MYLIAHGGYGNTVTGSALKADPGSKSSCRPGKLNLRQQHAGPDAQATELQPHSSDVLGLFFSRGPVQPS